VTKVALSATEFPDVSHNLLGQRLGRKGRGTRERILAATERLLRGPQDAPISLSAVAREASLAMTTLYLYFSDFTELLIAVLDPIMVSAEDAYLGGMRERWPDAVLGECCLRFVNDVHGFWLRHARALHLRNNYSAGDPRMIHHRVASARPLINLMIFQMDGDPALRDTIGTGMATALVTGIERVVTVTTDTEFANVADQPKPNVPALLRGQARLLEIGIRDRREC
jgi:AcrR family transcriptional regulator